MENNGKDEKIITGVYMYSNNLKRLRNEKELTQQFVAEEVLGCRRTTYNNWERGVVMIPIKIADDLSVFYKVSMSCVLGINKKIEFKKNINKMSYNTLLNNLKNLKKENKYSYNTIGKEIKCTGVSCQRYLSGKITIPMDRLIMLAKLYDIDIDELCGKVDNKNLIKN